MGEDVTYQMLYYLCVEQTIEYWSDKYLSNN